MSAEIRKIEREEFIARLHKRVALQDELHDAWRNGEDFAAAAERLGMKFISFPLTEFPLTETNEDTNTET